MQKLLLTFFTLTILTLNSCSKEESQIEYPQNGVNGPNILSFPDSIILDANQTFSLSANLENDAYLKIEMVNLSDFNQANLPIWFFNNARNEGWRINDYNMQYHTQLFESHQNGNLDLEISFPNSCIVEINFYENGGTLTQTKTLFW